MKYIKNISHISCDPPAHTFGNLKVASPHPEDSWPNVNDTICFTMRLINEQINDPCSTTQILWFICTRTMLWVAVPHEESAKLGTFWLRVLSVRIHKNIILFCTEMLITYLWPRVTGYLVVVIEGNSTVFVLVAREFGPVLDVFNVRCSKVP